MISIICVYNNKRTLDEVLLESLKSQTIKSELILLDNTSGRFKSAAEALNFGGKKATGDILVFIHQDMWIHDSNWVERVEEYVYALPDLGVAGVAGMDDTGKDWAERVKYSIKISNTQGFDQVSAVTVPETVQTLDECLLIIPRHVFVKQQFDSITFDGWDCYAADYCLSVAKMGYRTYVLPGLTSHCCLRANYEMYEFKDLLKYQKKLYKKYKYKNDTIYTWMGCLNPEYLKWSSRLVRFKPIYHFFFPEFRQMLIKKLFPCKSVLDLGCGYLSPLLYYKHNFSVGVDSDYHLLNEGKKLLIHDYYFQAKLPQVEFKSSTFDAVILLDVLDQLPKNNGDFLFKKMEQWARQKVIIKITNPGARPVDESLIKAKWTVREFKKRGYKVRGLSGLRCFKAKENRWDHHFIRERLNNITFWFCYFFPVFAREFLALKIINKGK